MYEAFYGLREKPFTLLPDPDYLYLSPKHQRALTLLEYGMMNHAGFSVICGDTGAGKTTLIRRLLTELGDDTTVGLITNTHRSFGELLNWVLMAFGLDAEGKSKTQMHHMFVDFLVEQYADNKHTVLIVDEAQNMTADTLEELRMLSNINADKDHVLQVILAGQPALRETLRRPELMQFAQRIAVDYYLEALSLEETRAYIHHRLKIAGSESEIFTDEACQAIYKYSGGTPRLINLLCDTSLVYGFAEQIKTINAQLVHDVVEEQHSNSIIPTFKTSQPHAIDSLPSSIENTINEIDSESVEQTFEERDEFENDAISKLTERAVQAVNNAERAAILRQATTTTVKSSVANEAAQSHISAKTESVKDSVEESQRNASVTPISAKHSSEMLKDNKASDEETASKNIEEKYQDVESIEEAEDKINVQNENTAAVKAQLREDDMEEKNSVQNDSRHSRLEDVYPIVHVEENPRKGINLLLLGLAGGLFVAASAMAAFAWVLFSSNDMGMSSKMQSPLTNIQIEEEQRKLEILQKERDAALAVSRALERERDAAITAAKAQQEMRAAEMRAAEILAQQEREAEARLREARARARAAERAEQKALERERILRVKAEERAAELEAQRQEASRLQALSLQNEKSLQDRAVITETIEAVVQPVVVEQPAETGVDKALEAEEVVSLSEKEQQANMEIQKKEKQEADKVFSANPCNSASAKFLSTCKK